MNKKVILFFTLLFGVIGTYIPIVFGDTGMFSGWNIFSGMIGGLFGVWLGVVVLKRWG